MSANLLMDGGESETTTGEVEQRVQRTLRKASQKNVQISAEVVRAYYTPDEEDSR